MMPNKSGVIELGAYDWRPKSPSSKWTFRLGNTTIELQKHPFLLVLFLGSFLFLTYFKISGTSLRSPDLEIYPLTPPIQTYDGLKYRIAVIADLDTDSKISDKSWHSYLKLGYLTWNPSKQTVQISWDQTDPEELKSSISTGGRGMELSELAVFNGNLYSVDDRTGIVYKISKSSRGYKVIPWVLLVDGNGEESKGFKCEWMTVKDQHLYVGGLGKEWTTQDGEVLNHNPMYVKRISVKGEIEHINWYDNYLKLRSRAGIEYPGEKLLIFF